MMDQTTPFQQWFAPTLFVVIWVVAIFVVIPTPIIQIRAKLQHQPASIFDEPEVCQDCREKCGDWCPHFGLAKSA